MKYIMLIGDGMADHPVEELGNQTPLQYAKTPCMDALAREGIVGKVCAASKGIAPSSDVAILSLLGYDPEIYYTGRGPLEASSMGITLGEEEIAFRCNLITADGDTLVDYSAGHIGNKEAKVLIKYLDAELGSEEVNFYPGVSYRHLMVVRGREELGKVKCTPPHNITGQSVKRNLPRGKGADFLQGLIDASLSLLDKHDINRVRRNLGENLANMIWPWGQGKPPSLGSFQEKFGLKGATISAVDVVKGLSKCLGLKVVKVEGATGYFDTNYRGKADAALRSLKRCNFVLLHVEAPDEAGHEGDIRAKVKAIEDFDSKVVGRVMEELKEKEEVRILVLPDHPTPVKLKTHTADPVPFAIWGSGIEPDGAKDFSEAAAQEGSVDLKKGHELMPYFLRL